MEKKSIVICSILFLLFLVLLISQCGKEERKQQPSIEEQPVAKEEEKQRKEQYTLTEEGNYEFACQDTGRYNVIEETVHVVYSAVSDDGITWTKEQFIHQGSVPEVIYFNGKYYMFVMAQCLMWVSDDGLSFEPYTYILENENLPEDFTGMRSFGVDPSAIVDDGLIRLFFYEPEQQETPTDPASIPGPHKIIQYSSEDAVTWQRVGEAVAVEGITDPDIVLYQGTYYLFLSHGSSAKAASSEDGSTFSVLNNGNAVQTSGGVPDTIVMNDALYMYAHRQEGEQTVIKILKSTNGVNWEEVGVALEDAEAPSVVQLPDGSYRMYYVKRVSEEEFEELQN